MSFETESVHDAVPRFDRRTVLKTAALGLMSTAMEPLITGCKSEDVEPTQEASRVTAYLPTDLDPDEYGNIQGRLGESLKKIQRIHLAFAVPEEQSGIIRPMEVTPQVRQLLGATAADVSIAIGGAGISKAAWECAVRNKAAYTRSVQNAREALEQSLQRPVHIDLDCESDIGSNNLTTLTHATRTAIPADRQLTMAVPADYMLSMFNTQQGGILDVVDTFHVMTYDQHGPWDDTSGPVMTGTWALNALRNWSQKVGNAQKLAVGYPAYGYYYAGATGPNQAYVSQNGDDEPSVTYVELLPEKIQDDMTTLTSQTMIERNGKDAWVSCVSPTVMQQIATQARSQYPDVNGSFLWALHGATPEIISAINR